MSFPRDANTILFHVDYSISASAQGEYRTQSWSYLLLPLRSTRSTKSPSISGQRAEFIETETWRETISKYRGDCWSAPRILQNTLSVPTSSTASSSTSTEIYTEDTRLGDTECLRDVANVDWFIIDSGSHSTSVSYGIPWNMNCSSMPTWRMR